MWASFTSVLYSEKKESKIEAVYNLRRVLFFLFFLLVTIRML